MVAGQPEDISVVLANFQAIAAVLNGGIDNANINAAAAIAISKLAGYPSDASKSLKGDGTWGPGVGVTPVSFQAPSAGASWVVTSLGAIAWLAPRWEYSDGTTSSVYGTVQVPPGVTNATLRVSLAANATTGNARITGFVASAADGEQLAPATWDILNSTQTVTMPSTAWLRKDATFSLTGLTGRDILPIAITRLGSDGADTLAANLAMFGAWLEPA
jgi:hypothetical protein